MIKRSEIIQGIESCDPDDRVAKNKLAKRLSSQLKSRASKRSSLADDLDRALIYCLVLFTGMYYMKKNVRTQLRPTIRAVMIAIGLFVVHIFEIAVLFSIASMLPNETYGYASIIFIMLFQMAFISTWVEGIRKKSAINAFGLHEYCINCRYDLSGLQSVLGPDLPVGPKVCPECGQDYPAIA